MDHVLVESEWRQECLVLFSGLPAYLVGVRCPLDVLEERERARKDRTLGQSRLQHEIVHRGLTYDLEVDTSLLTAMECAEQIRLLVESGKLPRALQMWRETEGQIFNLTILFKWARYDAKTP